MTLEIPSLSEGVADKEFPGFELHSLLEPIQRTFQKLNSYLGTLSPASYNYYKDANMPTAKTIVRNTGKPWNEILVYLGMPAPLDRDTLSRLSCSLHLLEKQIVTTFGLGWQEKNFATANNKKLRPDSFDVERAYIQNNRIFILDVKLSICSAPIAIYKYLPIFENASLARQMTFYSEWLSEDCLNDEDEMSHQADGQLEFFNENNILYIAYLIGKSPKNLPPGSEISLGRVDAHKKKKLPANMEVRFIEFRQLPALYCQLGGIEYNEQLVAPILTMAERIKSVILLENPNEVENLSRKIYDEVKNGTTQHYAARQS